jgi:hypothetical protein
MSSSYSERPRILEKNAMFTLKEALRNGWQLIDENYSKDFALVRKSELGRFLMGLALKANPGRGQAA